MRTRVKGRDTGVEVLIFKQYVHSHTRVHTLTKPSITPCLIKQKLIITHHHLCRMVNYDGKISLIYE